MRLTVIEKERIVAGLAKGLSLIDLAKEPERDRKTLFSFVENTKPRHDKNHITSRHSKSIRQVIKQPNRASLAIVDKAGIAPSYKAD